MKTKAIHFLFVLGVVLLAGISANAQSYIVKQLKEDTDFTVTVGTTSCGSDDGTFKVAIVGGAKNHANFTYELEKVSDGSTATVIKNSGEITSNTYTFEGLAPGAYRAKVTAKRPKMAIEYVAKYNVNVAGDGFATSHANNKSGYFCWTKGSGTTDPNYNPTGENIFDAPNLQGYHLPNLEEWRGIVPNGDTHGGGHLDSDSNYANDNITEKITVKGITATYTADYHNTKNGIAYGLRFKGNGNTMLSAFRYQAVGPCTEGDLSSHAKISVRYLGNNWTGTVDDIANEAFWSSNDNYDVERIFPFTGYNDEDGLEDLGTFSSLMCGGWDYSYNEEYGYGGGEAFGGQFSKGGLSVGGWASVYELIETRPLFAIRPFSNE